MIIDTKHKLLEIAKSDAEKRAAMLEFYEDARYNALKIGRYSTIFIDCSENKDDMVDFFVSSVDELLTMFKAAQDRMTDEQRNRVTLYNDVEMTLDDMVTGLESLEGDSMKYAKYYMKLKDFAQIR